MGYPYFWFNTHIKFLHQQKSLHHLSQSEFFWLRTLKFRIQYFDIVLHQERNQTTIPSKVAERPKSRKKKHLLYMFSSNSLEPNWPLFLKVFSPQNKAEIPIKTRQPIWVLGIILIVVVIVGNSCGWLVDSIKNWYLDLIPTDPYISKLLELLDTSGWSERGPWNVNRGEICRMSAGSTSKRWLHCLRRSMMTWRYFTGKFGNLTCSRRGRSPPQMVVEHSKGSVPQNGLKLG